MTIESPTASTVLSIGHSSLPYEQFIARLKSFDINAVADVRSAPFSRHFPQYNREALKTELARDGVAYAFLGKELGGRPAQTESYTDGVADYEKMARTPLFQEGLQRLLQGARRYRIAVMCSERDPLDCHRCLLVGRALKERGISVEHIVDNGSSVPHEDIEQQLMAAKTNTDMFADEAQQLVDAYREHARKVAFSETANPALMAS